MLTVSVEQLEALGVVTRRRFEERMVEHVRVRSRRNLPEAQLRERTQGLIALAEQHGIEGEPDIRRFLELVFDGVANCPRHPELVAVLNSPGIASSAKVAFIADILVSQAG